MKSTVSKVFEDLNNRFLMERGLVSTPKMKYQVLSCIFHCILAMATLGLKEIGKFLWEGREKVLSCWLSQFSKTKPKVAIAKFIWKMQKKSGKKRVGRHASFPPKRSVNWYRNEHLFFWIRPILEARAEFFRQFLKKELKEQKWLLRFSVVVHCTP